MRVNRAIFSLLVLATGCSGAGAPATDSAYDSEKALSTLVSALDAWKNGDAKALARRDPPIRFVDDDLAVGLRLHDYEIQEPQVPITLHQNVPVNLSLRDKKGKVIHREAHYQIAITPGLAVLRTDN